MQKIQSHQFPVPVINVGNLTVGGTGKTPHVEYLVRLLKNNKVAILSRGYKRQTSGFDQKRLELLSTVITKRAGINLTNFDVYLNIAGGLILKEPSMDLAVITSIISAWQDKTAPKETVIFGEVGLAGEVRSVTKTKERVKEAQKLGFKKIILPFFESQVKDVELIKVKEVTEILKLFKTS